MISTAPSPASAFHASSTLPASCAETFEIGASTRASAAMSVARRSAAPTFRPAIFASLVRSACGARVGLARHRAVQAAALFSAGLLAAIDCCCSDSWTWKRKDQTLLVPSLENQLKRHGSKITFGVSAMVAALAVVVLLSWPMSKVNESTDSS
jgi:hypothetical protein